MDGFLGEAIVLLVLGIIVFFAGRSMWRSHKNGGSCGGDCSSCGKCGGSCHKK